MSDDPRRRVPRTDAVLTELRAWSDSRATGGSTDGTTGAGESRDLVRQFGAARVKAAVARAQQRCRAGDLGPEDVARAAAEALTDTPPTSLMPLLNATGVVLHTNIGRAALSPRAIEALTTAAGHVDVEFDVATGRRARRGRGTLAALRAAVPAAEGALVVNNGAAALVLATTALAVAAGRPEVVMSRGEIVEIGDGFRLHELMASTGARIVEVGTTNRTGVDDYAAAVGERTGMVLKVHPSNFVVRGFTREARIAELASLTARVRAEHGLDVPLVADLGSGLLHPEPLLPAEPDATSVLTAGADLVTASGDKLLGGPQAGLVLGRADLVETLRRHPLARAVRVDKLTLAALEATLGATTPTGAALHIDLADLRRRSHALSDRLAEAGIAAEVVDSEAAVGGGGAPEVTLPGIAVAIDARLAAPLRTAGVITRVTGGRTLIDLRAIPVDTDARLTGLVVAAATAGTGTAVSS